MEQYHTGSSISYLSQRYNITKVTIYRWIKEFSKVKELEQKKAILKEHKKMKKHIAKLEIENKVLKKAAIIFARK